MYPEYPEYLSFQINLWRPSVEISSRMCQSNSCRKNRRWRANFTIWMSNRLYQYTCLLLINSLETFKGFKCNWNEFCTKEILYMIPKCIIAITKLSIIVMLRQWNRNNRKTFMLWFSIADSFHALSKSFVYISCKVVSTATITISTLNLIQDLGLSSWLLIVFVDARWIETRFDFTAYNMIVSCDFHGTQPALFKLQWPF